MQVTWSRQTAGSARSLHSWLVVAQSVPPTHLRQPPAFAVQVWMTVPEHWVSLAVVQSSMQAHTAGSAASSQTWPVASQSVPSTQSRHP